MIPEPAMTIDEVRRVLTAPGAPFETASATIGGRETRVWVNAPASLRTMLEATARFATREFLVYEGERATYGAFFRAVAALAERLVADGVAKGDRVAIVMRNLPEWPVAYFACAAIGAIATPLNAWWTTDELAYGLEDSGAKVAIVDGERLARIVSVIGTIDTLARVYASRASGELPAKTARLEEVIGTTADWADLPDRPLPAIEVASDDPAAIFYTSGTTGRPKGALFTHRNATANIQAIAFGAARAALRAGQSLPRPDPDAPPKVTLLPVPLFHVTGCTAILGNLVHHGHKLVFMHKWDATRALELIEAERINTVGGVPTTAWQLVEHPRLAAFDTSSVDRVTWGGAPSSPELARKVREVFPRSTASGGWGMTETSGVHTNNSGLDYQRKPDSCGAPVGDYEIKVCDAAGDELPAGEVGELWARGCNIALLYWNKPDASAATFVDGWVRTGDVARIDAEGFCFIVDRVKDMLIRGGENIYCLEVENALYQHPDVVDAAVVGIAHRTLGEEPGAVVMRRAGSTLDETTLRAFAAERIAGFKVPVRVLFLDEALPRNVNGKILKNELKAMFAEPVAA